MTALIGCAAHHFCSKLADWDDDDPSALVETTSKFDKVVILKHMFTLQELQVSCFPYQSSWPYRLTPHVGGRSGNSGYQGRHSRRVL